MNVLLVSGDFKHGGGMDRANYELAWHLAEDTRANVYLVAYHVAEPLASHPRVVWRPVPKPLGSYSLAASLLAERGRAEARWIQQQGGRTIVNGGNCCWPDINWAHYVQQSWEPRLAHAPFYARFRQRVSRRGVLQAEKRAFGMARIIVANSEQTRSKLIQLFDLPPGRVRTIYLGVDPQVFRPATPYEKLATRMRMGWPAGKLTAVFAGALGHDQRKGFDILFEAWKQLSANPDWDVDLVAAGGGAEVPFWQSQSEKAGLSRRVRMMGFTRDVPDLIRSADVMIQPSFYEAYGLSAHEALCCGVPALVTRSSGIAERYPAALSDLLLDHPPSVGNLMDRLRRWRSAHKDYRAKVNSFSSHLRRHTWSDMAREFVELTMPSLIEPDEVALTAPPVAPILK